MNALIIIQWSDLHFAAPLTTDGLAPTRAVKLATEAVNHEYGAQNFVLALTGDITTRGQKSGYTEALLALTPALSELGSPKVVAFPGNHDIGASDTRSFHDFNRFALSATGDAHQMWDWSNRVRTVTVGDYAIVLVNSAFEGDHRYGSAPLRELRDALNRAMGSHLIVMMHHSPISGAYAGGGMNDAYELLALIGEFPVLALLHGHVHSDLRLKIGEHKTVLYGAGSLGFRPDSNMNNQFAVHRFAGNEFIGTDVFKFYRNYNRFVKV